MSNSKTLISHCILDDIGNTLLEINATSPLKDAAYGVLIREYQVLNALLPIVVFLENTHQKFSVADLINVNQLENLMSLMYTENRFGATVACSEMIRTLALFPGYNAKASGMQTASLNEHYGYAIMKAKNLLSATETIN